MQYRHRHLASFFVATVLLWLFHEIGIRTDLYLNRNWFDVITHFLGGLTVGLGAVWFLVRTRPGIRQKDFFAILIVLVLAVGVLWELFEHFMNLPREQRYALDTAIDLIMDTLGALGAYIWWGMLEKRRNE